MDAPSIILFTVLGLCFGSFLNVVIARVPVKESIVAPGSRCPKCRTALAPRDNIPVLSWLALRGRCRTCHEPISVQYPLVEVLNAGLWALAAYQFTHVWVVVAVVLLLSTLLAISVVDLQLFRIPDRITFPALLGGIALTSAASYNLGGSLRVAWGLEKYALGGMVLYFAFMFVVHVIYPRGMGFGDVKLSLLLGLYLGWFCDHTPGMSPVLSTVAMVFWGLGLGCLLGLVFGVAWQYLAPGRDPLDEPSATSGAARPLRKGAFPFGPALALGTAVLVLFPALRP